MSQDFPLFSLLMHELFDFVEWEVPKWFTPPWQKRSRDFTHLCLLMHELLMALAEDAVRCLSCSGQRCQMGFSPSLTKEVTQVRKQDVFDQRALEKLYPTSLQN